MSKDWSALISIFPEELAVDKLNNPVERGDDINQIIDLMATEYKFRVDNIQYGTKYIDNEFLPEIERGLIDYNKFEIWFTNDSEERLIMYMYGDNFSSFCVYKIGYFDFNTSSNEQYIYNPRLVFNPPYKELYY